jgi:hypothetical protein
LTRTVTDQGCAFERRSADRPRKSHTRGEVMRALLIFGILLFLGAAAAQDRSSCFKNCDALYVPRPVSRYYRLRATMRSAKQRMQKAVQLTISPSAAETVMLFASTHWPVPKSNGSVGRCRPPCRNCSKKSLALRLGVLYLFRSMSLASRRKKRHPQRQTGRFRVGTENKPQPIAGSAGSVAAVHGPRAASSSTSGHSH